MAAGTSRELRGEVVVGPPRQRQVAFGMKITCAAVGGRTSDQVWGGTNRMRGQSNAPVRLRMLFVAPRAGSYTCALRAYVSSHVGFPNASLPLRRGSLSAGRLIPAGAGRQFTTNADANLYVPLGGSQRLFMGTLAAPATRLQVKGDVYLTECHAADNFCSRRSYPRSGTARAWSQLIATP